MQNIIKLLSILRIVKVHGLSWNRVGKNQKTKILLIGIND